MFGIYLFKLYVCNHNCNHFIFTVDPLNASRIIKIFTISLGMCSLTSLNNDECFTFSHLYPCIDNRFLNRMKDKSNAHIQHEQGLSISFFLSVSIQASVPRSLLKLVSSAGPLAQTYMGSYPVL